MDVTVHNHERQSRWKRLLTGLGVFFGGYPIAVVATIYLTWVAAWMTVGHVPKYMLDDPSSLGLAVDIMTYLSSALFLGSPVAFGLGLVIIPLGLNFNRRKFSIWTSILVIFIWLLLWVASAVLLRWDPIGVLQWYID